jgi:hypothetical protein
MSVFPPDHQTWILKYESVGVVLVKKWRFQRESAALRLGSAAHSCRIHPFFPKSILTHFRILGMENAFLVVWCIPRAVKSNQNWKKHIKSSRVASAACSHGRPSAASFKQGFKALRSNRKIWSTNTGTNNFKLLDRAQYCARSHHWHHVYLPRSHILFLCPSRQFPLLSSPCGFVIKKTLPSPSGVFLLMSRPRPQFLGRALGALRSIGRTNRHEDKHGS